MKKTNLLYSTLVATALTLSPLITTPLNATVTHATQTSTTSFHMVNILHNRGLDEDAAQKLVSEFIGSEEELFSILLENLESRCSVISRKDIMNYISTLALQRKSINLDSYSALINMVHKITHETPSRKTLEELQNIAKINFAYSQFQTKV